MYFQRPLHSVPSHFQRFSIEVTGEGEIEILPNSAVVKMGVMTDGKDLQNAQQQNSITLNNVIQAIIRLGVTHQHIQTFDYRISSQYDFENGKQLFRGYKVTHLLQIQIEDLSLVGKIIDTAVQQGANYVADVQFTAGSKEVPYRKALSLSLNDALQKAKMIARTLKVTIEPSPFHIIEGYKREDTPSLQPGTYVKGISSTAFEPGRLKIKAFITAYFRFNP